MDLPDGYVLETYSHEARRPYRTIQLIGKLSAVSQQSIQHANDLPTRPSSVSSKIDQLFLIPRYSTRLRTVAFQSLSCCGYPGFDSMTCLGR
jgi:hypothetical protein